MINLTVTPANDAGSFGGDLSGTGAEDGGAITGTLSFTDAIDGDSAPNFTVTGPATSGAASINNVTGAWSYTPGAHFNGSDSFTVTVTDDDGHSETQVINLTVTPVDDPAVISGDVSYTGNEGDAVGGDMDATDVDGLTDGTYFSVTTPATNGTANINAATGVWTFTPTDPNWFGSDAFTVTITDDLGGTTTQVVNITLSNVDDAAVISGDISGTVAEDGTPSATGTLSISDADPADNPIDFPDQAPVAGDNGYGSFELTGGVWTYTLNNAHGDVQALEATDTLTDTHTFTASDGSTQVVTVTINGAAEAVALPPLPVEPPAAVTQGEPLRSPQGIAISADGSEEAEASADYDAGEGDTATEDSTPDAVVEAEAAATVELAPQPSGHAPQPLVPEDLIFGVLAARDAPQVPSAAEKPSPEAARSVIQEWGSLWGAEETPLDPVSFALQARHGSAFWMDVDDMLIDLDQSAQDAEERLRLNAETAAGVSISLTAGFVSWAMRAGSMVASFLAAMPTWRSFDPMPVLAADEAAKDMAEVDDDESLPPVDQETDAKVDALFDR